MTLMADRPTRHTVESDAEALFREAKRRERRRRLIAVTAVLAAGAAVLAVVNAGGFSGSSGRAPRQLVGPASTTHAVGTAPKTLHWSPQVLGTAAFTAIACPSATRCIAAGLGGWTAWSGDGGRSWKASATTHPVVPAVTRIACPSAQRCVEVGTTSEFLAGSQTGIAAVSSDGGETWTPAGTAGSIDFLGGLSCPTATICYATAARTSSFNDGLAESTDAGAHWHLLPGAPPPPAGSTRGAFSGALSCPVVGQCWATGGPGGILATTDGGATWVAETEPQGGGGVPGIGDLTCLTTQHCIAVGSEPHPGSLAVIATNNGGATWRFAPWTADPKSYAMGGSGGLDAISCSTTGYCVAVGGAIGAPIVLSSHDGGLTWRALATPSAWLGGGLLGVTCSRTPGCLAVGSAGNEAGVIAGAGEADRWTVRLQELGSTWTSLSCPSVRECIAVGSLVDFPMGAEIAATLDGGASWVQRRLPAGVLGILGVDCPTPRRCFATGVVPPPSHSSTSNLWAAALLQSDDGGRTWTRESLPRALFMLNAISCPTSTDCVAVGATGYAGIAQKDAIVTTTDGGAHWTTAVRASPAGRAHGLTGVSCPTALRCWAVGPYGVLMSSDGGRTWKPQPGAGVLQAISCPTTSMCVAVSNGAEADRPVHVTRDGGRTWLNPHLPVSSVALTGVDCPSAAECLVVGASPSGASVFATFNGGRSWSTEPFHLTALGSAQWSTPSADAAVSCPTLRHCVVLGGGGTALGGAEVAQVGIGR